MSDADIGQPPADSEIESEVTEPVQLASPYEGHRLSIPQHLALSSYWLATNAMWGALLVVMLASQIGSLAPDHRVQILGWITSLGAIPALVVPLVAGALSDRCTSRWGRRRPYILAGSIVNLAGLGGMLLAFQSRSLAGFFVAYLITQIGNNVATAAYSGVIPDLVPSDQRGIASGYMALMSQVGTLIGALASGFLLEMGDVALAYAAVGGVLTLFLVITLLGIKETPLPYKPPPIRWGPYLRSLWIDPRKYPDFAWVWMTRALVMFGFYSIQPFLQYYLADIIGVRTPESTAGQLIGILLIGASLSGLVGGWISERTGRKRVVYVANVGIAVMSLALILCRSIEQVLLVGVLFGLAYGAYISVDWALGTDVLPSKETSGKDMAVWHVSMVLPQTIGAPIAGFVLGSFGTRINLDYWAESAASLAGKLVPGMPELPSASGYATHYTIAGYSSIFIMAACFFVLGAFLLRNVRGAR